MKNISFLSPKSKNTFIDSLLENSNLHSTPECLALEQRIVFDGAGAVTGVTLEAQNDTQNTDDTATEPSANIAELAGVHKDDVQSEVTEIAFIDMRLPQAQQLAETFRDSVLIVYIDPAKNGAAQVTQSLSSFESIDTIHLFTHGDANGFRLGDTTIAADTIEQSADDFSAWKGHLSSDADILFYGCNLAETAQGRALLNTISTLTSADISASNDLTGASNLGGDWDLEFNIGTINSALAITESGQQSYASVLAAVPEATISAPAEDPLIGEQITFTVTFDNTSAVDTGYGPYVNLFLPFLGADGVYNTATDTYTSSADGVSFVSATYLGAAVDSTVITLEDIDGGTAGLQFNHPEAVDTAGDPLVVTLDAGLGLRSGDQLILLKLPFGSYTPDQPTAPIVITANVSADADVGTGLDVVTSAGFTFGNTALDDFDTDPSVQAATLTAGNTNSATLTPQIYRLNTTLNAPEGETATGPNFERSYSIEVEVAAGETIDAASLDFTFAEELVYTSGSSTGGGVLDVTNLGQVSAGDLTDDVLTVDFAALSGTQTITANFYVAEFDQAGADVLSPLTGAAQSLGEAANVVFGGNWTPNDTRDATGPLSDTSTAPTIAAKSIATQKGVTIQTDTGHAGATPGDTLEYTIDVQISDFFAYDTLAVADIFADGQLLDGGFTPTLSVTRQGAGEGPYSFTTDFIDTTIGDDDHQLDFDISGLLTTNAVSGILEGGKFGADDLAGTTLTITYRTIIQDEYDSNVGNLNLKQGDTLASTVTVEGRLLDGALAAVAGPVMVTDGSGASVTVPNNNVSLSIYALNGATGGTLTNIKPGDDVTFRLEYDLVTGDLENFILDAYLPLPVFSVDDIDANGAGGDSFVLDNGNAVPTVGDFRYGPTATADITGGVPSPTVTTDAVSNFVQFNLGDLADVTNDGGKIDILFTIRTTNTPFADGLLLTTLAEQGDDNSPTATSITNDLGQITLQQPEILQVIKGVVATDVSGGTFTPGYTSGTPSGVKDAGNVDANPLSAAVNSTNLTSLNLDGNMSGVDEGDLVRFALIIENTGSSPNGAFDITISDTLPAGFVVPGGGLNLRAVNGAGTTIAIDTASPDTALFAGGIVFTDGGTGALDAYHATNGQNILIVTYDLQVDNLAQAGVDLTNTVTLSNYANTEGGPDFTAVDLSDTAIVTIAGAQLNKIITDTDQVSTTGNNVIIGEIVEYTLTISVPEGLSSTVSLVDNLDAGLAFIAIDSIVASSGDITTDAVGGYAGVASNVIFANVGGGADNDARRATFDFGNITNVNTDNTTAETITIVYRAAVLNTSNTDGGSTLNNSATWTSTNHSDTDTAPNVTVVEPQVNVTVTPNTASADTGDTITWTVVLTAPGGNLATAFDVNFDNVIPAGLTYVGASLSNTAGVVPTSLTENGGDFNATYTSLTAGQTSTFTFQTTIDTGAGIGDTLTNAGTATWHSIAGALADPSTLSTVDTERTGAGGINDYTNTGNGDVTIPIQAPTLALEDSSESATAGSDVAVGEVVRYRFTMRIPESTTADFRVEPNIPAGLQFLNDGTATVAFISDGGLSADGAGLAGNGLIVGNEATVAGIDPTFVIPGGLITGGPFNDGTDPQFRLGALTNLDSDINQEFIVIEFNALVLNVASVDDGDTITVNAEALEGASNISTTNNVGVDVEEAVIGNLIKRVTSTDGTTATFTITFNNTSGNTAFDINVLDNLPANLSNLQVSSITPAGGVAGVTDNSTVTGLDVDITDFPTAGSVTIVYTADIIDAALVVANTNANVTWTSLDGGPASLTTAPGASTGGAAGTSTGERTGAGGVNDYTVAEGAGLNTAAGTLWEDINLDDVIDGGEVRISGVQVNLIYAGLDDIFGNGDDITLTDITDVNGDYNFGALPVGDYRISVQPNGSANGIGAQYAPSFDATGSQTDNLIERTLGEGAASINNDFGFELAQPPAGADKSFTIGEDTTLTFAAVDFGFTDPNPADTFANVRIDSLPTGGTLNLSGTPVTSGQVITVANIPNLTFTPNQNATGTPLTTFTFSVQDNTSRFDILPNTFTINITPDMDPPLGADKSYTIEEDTILRFVEDDFGFTDPDIGDRFDNVRIDTLPLDGTLKLNGVDVTAGQIITTAQIPDLTFTPEKDAFGNPYADFTFTVQDDTGLFDTIPNTFTIIVTDVIDLVHVIPPDPTPIPGTGTVPNVPPPSLPPPYSGNEPPVTDPVTGLRNFEVALNPFKDDSMYYRASVPEFWLSGTVDNKLMIETKEMAFQVSKAIFQHSNPGEALSFEAELADGSPIPGWLAFDSGDLSFKGTPPKGSPEAIEIVVIAKDTRGEEIKAPVRVIINRDLEEVDLNTQDSQPVLDVEDAPATAEESLEPELQDSAPQELPEESSDDEEKQGFMMPQNGRPSFSDQIHEQTRFAQVQRQQAFLNAIDG
jgi:fimbrial isopeptide formation D2 family protein/uncharacterized repeat protein (TIGR01451 family)